jgi:hypothetical protein
MLTCSFRRDLSIFLDTLETNFLPPHILIPAASFHLQQARACERNILKTRATPNINLYVTISINRFYLGILLLNDHPLERIASVYSPKINLALPDARETPCSKY